jgi:hypothetical protein
MFESLRRRSTPPSDLLDIIADVRSRWRLKLALRGLAYVVGVLVVLFLVAASGLEWWKFSAPSILAARVLMVAAVLGSIAWFIVRPLRRQVTDEQVALYLEEHEPSLEARVVSAVEAQRSGDRGASAALVRRLVEQAIEACVRMDAVHRMEQTPLRRYTLTAAGIALAALLVVMVGPAFLRHAVSAMLLIQGDVQAAAPYKIEVTPGNSSVPKGSDQTIKAKLLGFESEDVVLMVRRTPTAAFEAIPIDREDDGSYEGTIFDIDAPLEYQVVADRVQSALFTFKVVDIPYVQQLELEYHYPAYTGLEPEKIEDGGDIAVLRGTQVKVRVTPTMKTPGGRIIVDDKTNIALALEADGKLTASFTAARDGFYRVELQAPATSEMVAGSPQYTIDVLEDQAPSVSFSKPGRDTTASSIEEVFVEATAQDDFGVRDLELVYSVNGGEEKTVKLFAGSRRLPEVSAGHTFYLEELGVEAGDSVSYYARAADNDAAGGKRAASDLYFVRVRPFKKDFRQAQSQGGGGGGGGGGGNQIDALSEQQRQVISATFNVNRDRKGMSADKLRESSKIVGLAQGRLRDQVENLLTRMNSQLVERDPAFAKIAELLPQAVKAMQDAEGKLSAATPDQALPSENQALRILQKADD